MRVIRPGCETGDECEIRFIPVKALAFAGCGEMVGACKLPQPFATVVVRQLLIGIPLGGHGAGHGWMDFVFEDVRCTAAIQGDRARNGGGNERDDNEDAGHEVILRAGKAPPSVFVNRWHRHGQAQRYACSPLPTPGTAGAHISGAGPHRG